MASSAVQPALPMVAPGKSNLQHVCITMAPSLATWPLASFRHLVKSLSQELVNWQTCQQWPQLHTLEQVSIPQLG